MYNYGIIDQFYEMCSGTAHLDNNQQDEILRDDSVRLAEQARAAGVEAEIEIWEGMWHVFHSATAFGVPESQAALDKIGEFVRKHI